MAPKRFYTEDDSDESSDSSEETTTSSEEGEEESSSGDEQPVVGGHGAPPGGRSIANKPHDLEFDADDAEHRKTPPGGSALAPQAAPVQSGPGPSGGGGAVGGSGQTGPLGNLLRDNPNDESFAVDDDRHIRTPPGGATRGAGTDAPPQKKPSALQRGMLQNDSHDEFEDVEDDMPEESTPVRHGSNRQQQQQQQQQQQPRSSGGALGADSSQIVQNQHHDEEIDVSGDSHSQVTASPTSTAQSSPQSVKKLPPAQQQQQQQHTGKIPAMMKPDDDSDESSSSDDDDDAQPRMGKDSQPKTMASIEYNPDDYAHLNNKVSREVRDLFTHITAYQALPQELPSKLIPFIPDYLPCVGDIDAFCKVPRPDSKPDNLGLVVIDEPCANQSNPAVVIMGLQYTSKQHSHATFVDSVENAQNRPQVIDQWIADIKQLHYKKPLPTVNYSKPMPDIESLLQVWPQEFEDLLNSDVQFPPPGIDLDIEQYVRVMCAILDIPTYGNLIESLHVMFTLYLEFRANQHFQHA